MPWRMFVHPKRSHGEGVPGPLINDGSAPVLNNIVTVYFSSRNEIKCTS